MFKLVVVERDWPGPMLIRIVTIAYSPVQHIATTNDDETLGK
jgi:hypothetical protein